jgi:hypothetical protein
MAALTVQDVSRRSGLSEPTVRWYEEVGLIGPITREHGNAAAAQQRDLLLRHGEPRSRPSASGRAASWAGDRARPRPQSWKRPSACCHRSPEKSWVIQRLGRMVNRMDWPSSI